MNNQKKTKQKINPTKETKPQPKSLVQYIIQVLLVFVLWGFFTFFILMF